MKKTKIKRSKIISGDMLPEYDFTGKKGVRGKYYQAYRQGHTVRVLKNNGTARVQYFTLAEGAVMLEPDVREYFPDFEAVNTALRTLITIVPSKPPKTKSNGKPRRARAKA
jgi:hypothetical protein